MEQRRGSKQDVGIFCTKCQIRIDVVPDNIAVSQHRAFWKSGRARGIHNEQRIVRARARDFRRCVGFQHCLLQTVIAWRRALDRKIVMARQAIADAVDHVSQLRIYHQRVHASIADNEGKFFTR